MAVAGCGDDGGGTPSDGGDGSAGTCEPGPVTCPRDPPVCGNGTTEPGEACDDGNTEPDDGCDESCAREPDMAPAEACDLTGHWMVQKLTVSEAPQLGTTATTAIHFYYRIAQDGDSIEVVDSLHCGFYVQAHVGGVTIDLNQQTRDALRCQNSTTGRTGTVTAGASDCQVSFDTWYTIRGLSPHDYWLDDDWAGAATGQGTPSNPPPADPNCECTLLECTCDDTGRYDPDTGTPGWADWDNDCMPGITMRPGGSEWYSYMRDWDRYSGTIPQEASGPPQDFRLETEWSNVSGVMAVAGPIESDENPVPDANHCALFRRMPAPDRTAMTDAELCQSVVDGFLDVDVLTACD